MWLVIPCSIHCVL